MSDLSVTNSGRGHSQEERNAENCIQCIGALSVAVCCCVVLFLATYLLMTFRTDVQMLKLFYCPNYEVYHN